MISESMKQWLGKAYIATLCSCLMLALISFGYGFQVGAIEARGIPRWVPRECVQVYCWPAKLIDRVPIIRVWVALANQWAYELAGGPETTR